VSKAYWISCYHEVIDPLKFAAYAKLAGPAIEAGGGRFLARAVAAQAYEHGKLERIVVIEFDSLQQALALAQRQVLSEGRRSSPNAHRQHARVGVERCRAVARPRI